MNSFELTVFILFRCSYFFGFYFFNYVSDYAILLCLNLLEDGLLLNFNFYSIFLLSYF